MPKKNPFKNFTEEQVAKAENGSFVIQVGYEVFYEGNYCTFSLEKSEHYLEIIKQGLKDMIKNGTDREREDALRSCFNLRVIPLRIQ